MVSESLRVEPSHATWMLRGKDRERAGSLAKKRAHAMHAKHTTHIRREGAPTIHTPDHPFVLLRTSGRVGSVGSARAE